MAANEDREFRSSKIDEFLLRTAIVSNSTIIRDKNNPSSNKRGEKNIGKKITTGFFTLDLSSDYTAGGTADQAYELNHVPDSPLVKEIWGQRGFKAYWLAYEADQAYRAVLGNNDAEYMFTANMTGCTFAYGTQTTTGHILVGHSNAAMVGSAATSNAIIGNMSRTDAYYAGRAAQADAQHAAIIDKFEKKGGARNNVVFLKPDAYGVGSYTDSAIPEDDGRLKYGAFVVGTKENNKWNFYCQRRTTFGKLVIVHDVLKL